MKWNELPLVEVIWIDAAEDPTDETELDKLQTFGESSLTHDIGYLIGKNKELVRIARTIVCNEDTVRNSLAIPSNMVKKIIYLKRGNVRQHPRSRSK